MMELDAVIVGGGFYGCSLALHISGMAGARVRVLEAGSELMRRASYVNQARVHHGYHYPRSLLTGLRSSLNFERFTDEYADCVTDNFDAYYAIARTGSNVTADQFARFCARIRAPLAPAPPEIVRLFDPQRIERVYRVRECAFDARRLRCRVADAMAHAAVQVELHSDVRRLRRVPGGVEVTYEREGTIETVTASRVFTCVYSRTNQLLAATGLPPIPLKHEVTEIALAMLPPPFDRAGVTVMCGPFFSFMPFPPLGVHSFTHVRYTPHASWEEGRSAPIADPYAVLARFSSGSRFTHMLKDAVRYIPSLADSRYVSSLWEIKTVLPRSELDDSRPILFRSDAALPEVACVIGAKIDNVYDMMDEVHPLQMAGEV